MNQPYMTTVVKDSKPTPEPPIQNKPQPVKVSPPKTVTKPNKTSPPPTKELKPQKPKTSKLKRLIPPALITFGSLLIANAAWPIISHELLISPSIRRDPILSPLQDGGNVSIIPASRQVEVSSNETAQALGSDTDYTNAKNWFPTAEYPEEQTYEIKTYFISIPEVNIEDAKVEIGGDSLEQGLIHYPGTSLPGQLGSPVVFGHSVLRQFYAPEKSNPNRYVSIFSKIMTLKDGDEIFVDYDGIKYTYQVKEKVEVQPEDVFILQQRLNNRELKLITCTPEGTYLRRGVIIAELIDLN